MIEFKLHIIDVAIDPDHVAHESVFLVAGVGAEEKREDHTGKRNIGSFANCMVFNANR